MEPEKNFLRAEIRRKFTPPRPETSASIRIKLQTLDCWKAARRILTYHPLAGEADLLPLLETANTKEWIFPKVHGECLSLHRWSPEAPWISGSFGIREPDPKCWPLIDPDTVDLALIPGLAFDREGNRLGRGKGYYDRLLARSGFRALRIGIITERFLLPEVPTEPHDLGMDLVVTESSVHSAKGSRLDKGQERG